MGLIAKLPTTFACGFTFTIQNGISYKKGEFINIFYNNLRELVAKPLWEVCHDAQVKPSLLPLTEERMEHRTAIKINKAKLDIQASRFWIRGQQAFLDVGGIWPKHMLILKFILMTMLYNQQKREKVELYLTNYVSRTRNLYPLGIFNLQWYGYRMSSFLLKTEWTPSRKTWHS